MNIYFIVETAAEEEEDVHAWKALIYHCGRLKRNMKEFKGERRRRMDRQLLPCLS